MFSCIGDGIGEQLSTKSHHSLERRVVDQCQAPIGQGRDRRKRHSPPSLQRDILVPARVGLARSSPSLCHLPAPIRAGPPAPCAGAVGWRSPSCPLQRFTDSSDPSPGPAPGHAAVGSLRLRQAPGACPSMRIGVVGPPSRRPSGSMSPLQPIRSVAP